MKTLLCAIGRLENDYIREWVEYYKKLGFTNICLFDNNKTGEQDFRTEIQSFIDDGFVILKDYRNKEVCQLEAYTECYNTYGDSYDWIAFFDCDEFLTLVKNKTIEEYLSRLIFKNIDMIHINWMNYTDNGLVKMDNRPVLERFTTPCPYDYKCEYTIPENYHIKTLMRGGLGKIEWKGNPHTPGIKGLKCVDGGGRTTQSHSPFAVYTYTDAYIKHFTTKTAEEYANKLLRGFPDQQFEFHKQRWKMLLNTIFFRTNEVTQEKIDLFKEKLGIDMSYLLKQNENSDVKIFSLCYTKKNFELLHDSVVTPLQVGAAINNENVCDLKDNTGENISSANFFFIENTGTFWIWKNIHGCKYKGQMQYRRPLSGVNETMDFEEVFKKYDVITCKPFNHPTDGLPTKENGFMAIPAKTVEEGYAFSNCGYDLEILEQVIKEYYPGYVDNYKKYIKDGENLYYSSGYILRAEDYDKYAEFLFGVLSRWLEKTQITSPMDLYFHVGRNIGAGKYIRFGDDPYKIPKAAVKWQTEIGGFLGERIWTLWLLSNYKPEKILELPYIKQEEGMYT